MHTNHEHVAERKVSDGCAAAASAVGAALRDDRACRGCCSSWALEGDSLLATAVAGVANAHADVSCGLYDMDSYERIHKQAETQELPGSTSACKYMCAYLCG